MKQCKEKSEENEVLYKHQHIHIDVVRTPYTFRQWVDAYWYRNVKQRKYNKKNNVHVTVNDTIRFHSFNVQAFCLWIISDIFQKPYFLLYCCCIEITFLFFAVYGWLAAKDKHKHKTCMALYGNHRSISWQAWLKKNFFPCGGFNPKEVLAWLRKGKKKRDRRKKNERNEKAKKERTKGKKELKASRTFLFSDIYKYLNQKWRSFIFTLHIIFHFFLPWW